MADETLTVLDAKAVIEQGRNMDKLGETYRRVAKDVSATKDEIKKAADAYRQSQVAFDNHYNSLNEIDQKSVSLTRSTEGLKKSITDVTSAFGMANTKSGDLASSLGGSLIDSAKGVGKAFLATSPTIRDFINPLGEANLLSNASIPILGSLQKAMKNLLTTQTTARLSFIMLGGSIDKANEAALNYPKTLRDMSSLTGISTKSLDEMNKVMRGIPGVMDRITATSKNIGIDKIFGKSVQPVAILGVVMTAFGKTSAEAAKFGAEAWYNFNQKPPETIRQMGLVAAAAKDTNVDLGKTHDQILAASQSMALFGGKTAVASNVWRTFNTALKDSGVPINAIGSMVTDLVAKMANMTTQNRAFIGLMSGMSRGSTALGGALKMEMNLRSPGGLEKNLEAMTSTLSRFGGGKIITLEQAANNPQLEMQFVLQRQMLGKLTGISNPEQQNRILQTLGKVQEGGITRLQGTKALQDVYAKGKTVQDKMLTVLERIDQGIRASIGGKFDGFLNKIDSSIRQSDTGNLRRSGTGALENFNDAAGYLGVGRRDKFEIAAGQLGNATKGIGNKSQMPDKLNFNPSIGDLGSNYASGLTGNLGFPGLSNPNLTKLPMFPGITAVPRAPMLPEHRAIAPPQMLNNRTSEAIAPKAEGQAKANGFHVLTIKIDGDPAMENILKNIMAKVPPIVKKEIEKEAGKILGIR